MSKPTPTLPNLLDALLPATHLTQPPSHPTNASLTPAISSLLLHPTIEATLHLLNANLPSAHFLVRHMQAPPAIEGMLLHSILHRCEGDMPNSRLWASDVQDANDGWVPKHKGEQKLGSDVLDKMKREGEGDVWFLEFVYGEKKDECTRLTDDVERFRKEKGAGGDSELEGRLRRELERVLEWCTRKFGDGEWVDASEAWVKHSEEVRKKGEDMVSGGKGFRDF